MSAPDAAAGELKANMTWVELKAVVEEWIRYGDDPFEDAMSELYEQIQTCTEHDRVEVLKAVLEFMKMLQKWCPHLQ